jgi:hypothetical protein
LHFGSKTNLRILNFIWISRLLYYSSFKLFFIKFSKRWECEIKLLLINVWPKNTIWFPDSVDSHLFSLITNNNLLLMFLIMLIICYLDNEAEWAMSRSSAKAITLKFYYSNSFKIKSITIQKAWLERGSPWLKPHEILSVKMQFLKFRYVSK